MSVKWLVGIVILFICCGVFLKPMLLSPSDENVTIVYPENINSLSIDTLKNLRYLTAAEKKELFSNIKFAEQFAIENAINVIKKSTQEPNIVLWFTNHYGQIPQKCVAWYKQNVFDQFQTNATFWLVDLSAWRFLSLRETELLDCSDFVVFKQLRKSGIDLLPSQCPLTQKSDSLLAGSALSNNERYKIMHADDFFSWLHRLSFSIDEMDDTLTHTLIRTDKRAGAAKFSLRELGYRSALLTSGNLLEIDHTQIFSLLQYLEGLFYALCVIKDSITKNKSRCDIVFLLPNKEFTYYTQAKESTLFKTFGNNLSWIITKLIPDAKKIKIRLLFYPFAYGADFYDQPYDETGPYVTREVNFKNSLGV